MIHAVAIAGLVAMIGLLLYAFRLLRRERRRQWYREVYLTSDHWRAFRRAWWEAHPEACCARCGGVDHPMDLHHRTYRRLGRERFEDVVPLHRHCHELVEAAR